MPQWASRLIVWSILLSVAAGPAVAHKEGGMVGGFVSGLAHPITGWDHVVAMLAVGLWGAFLGPPAIWLLPMVFPLVMAGGGVLGILGVPIPSAEIGIALSAIVLGSCVLFALRPALWIAASLVGLFAVFHGHAHGTELPSSAEPLAYAAGFVMATGLLHVCGIALGQLTRWRIGHYIVRASGGAIALAGLGFLMRHI